jgi:hypothetical protein
MAKMAQPPVAGNTPETGNQQQADEWGDLSAYTPDSWAPQPAQLSPTMTAWVGQLLTTSRLVVGTDGWSTDRLAEFMRTVKAAPGIVGERRVRFRAGTVEGKPAMLVTLSQARDAA